jgi:hypothetical protein
VKQIAGGVKGMVAVLSSLEGYESPHVFPYFLVDVGEIEE